MCGIAGIVVRGGAQRDYLRDNISRMTSTLRHRGPDRGGIWIDAHGGVALGHRRLAILDLTDAGSQPMISTSGRYVITLNGEIYNFRELRRSLQSIGFSFRSSSDTEVVLAGVEAWGLDDALRAFDGMFAFGLWDRREYSLVLARDRFGEKPVYYAQVNGEFVFASDLCAIEAFEGFAPAIDDRARTEFLDRGYISAPRTIYREVNKLEAAHIIRPDEEPRRYWRITRPEPRSSNINELTDELDQRLHQAVASRSVSDVPVGAFLSGGVDSSAVVAMMTGAKTFTIGFAESRYDESKFAGLVARHLGTQHEELIVTPREAMRVIPLLSNIYCEPFADSSQIPALLVSELASRRVKVALAGDGGDELFVGYPRYRQLARIAAAPLALRRVIAPILQRLATGEKAQMLAKIMSAPDLARMYQALMGRGHPIGRIDDPLLWMSIHDLENYFVDDLLVKLDRAAMSVGLETRLPLLDPGLVEFALSLPPSLRAGKMLLRRVLARYVPERLLSQRKQGFMLPIASWLRGPLRDWAEDLIPGVSRELPPGSRCVGIWSRLVLEAWLRRPSVPAWPADPQLVSAVDPA